MLRSDDGARWRLELGRTPVDLMEKRVRVMGEPIDDGTLQVSAIAQDAE